MITKRKSRYVLVEASSLEAQHLFTGFDAEMLRIMGQVSYTRAAPKAVAQYGRYFAVRVNRGLERDLILASAFARVGGIGFRTIKTSGTIRTIAEHAAKLGAAAKADKG